MIVIIPAAGYATRMRPLSNNMSKAMIPVNGKPIISYIIDHLEKIIVDKNLYSNKNQYIIIENEFHDISNFTKRVYPNLDIHYAQQTNKCGPLDAVRVGLRNAGYRQEDICIWLGDTICLEEFNFNKDFLAVSKVTDYQRWCLIDNDGILHDKPKEDPLTRNALIGIYYFKDFHRFLDSLYEDILLNKYPNDYNEMSYLINRYQSLCKYNFEIYSTDKWYDCGELQTYYESKSRLITNSARSFNHIEINTFENTITKSSSDKKKQEKIEDEKKWFNSLSESQKVFVPQIYESSYGSLKMSLESGTALNDVYVYENLRTDIWYSIIDKILKIHHDYFYLKLSRNIYIDDACKEMYRNKTIDRIIKIENILNDNKFYITDNNLIENIKNISNYFSKLISELLKNIKWSSLLHGDSHLGNIIYDPFTGALKFVDPRGKFGNIKNEGDMNYDMAKLLQDFYCGYALIQANKFEIIDDKINIFWNENSQDLLKHLESKLINYGYDIKMLKGLAIMLLFTAIPFNEDPKIIQAMFLQTLQLIKNENSNN